MKRIKYLTQGEKLRRTMIAKHGSMAKYRKFMREAASKSKRNPTGKGGILDVTEEKRRELARQGGIARSEKYRLEREEASLKEADTEEQQQTEDQTTEGD